MKKIIVFILILGCLSFVAYSKNGEKSIFDLNNITKVCLVSSEKYADAESVECGKKYFNYCSVSTAEEIIKKAEVDAVQVYIEGYSFDKFKQDYNLEIVSSLSIGEMQIINAWSSLFKDSVLIGNEKVNVQIAVCENKLIAGFPMILTGY